MKNQNKVRHISYGRKELYFYNLDSVSRFINLYEDLFVDASWVRKFEDNFVGPNLVKTVDKGDLYKLVFLMDHEDFRNIEKDLKIRRVSFTIDFGPLGTEKYSKRIVS